MKEILIAGGPVLAGMILLSIYCCALIWERWKFFKRSTGGATDFLAKVRASADAGKLPDAAAHAKTHKGLASAVVMATLSGASNRDERRRGAERAAGRAIAELEAGISTLGTIASVAPFIGLFGAFLVLWVLVNTVLLVKKPLDPYPFIFLNLLLSMLAAIQAPIIMMSQNRHSQRDREMAEHDYEVNLKAEIEILALHDKLEQMRIEHTQALINGQVEQMAALKLLLEQRSAG